MRIPKAFVVFAVLTGPAHALAEEPKKMEPVVVTATKIETPAEQLGATVTVVTGEEFKSYSYATVDEALRSVPGLDVQRGGGLGKLSNVTIRGARPGQVQVLIDGARVKSANGTVDFSDISADLIERIEIIRGPQSTLYGADAIGGVINIITKKGKGPFTAMVQQEAGNYDTLRTRTEFSGSYRILDYSFSASHIESNGQFRNDGLDQNAINERLGVSLPGNSSLAFILRFNRNDAGLAVQSPLAGPQPIVPVIDVNSRSQSETMVMTLNGRTRPVPWWESEVRLSRYENDLGGQDTPDPGFDLLFIAQTHSERREAEWVNHFHIGKWSTSSVGLEYRRDEARFRSTFAVPFFSVSNAFRPRAETQSVFFQEQLRLFDRLFASGGFRVEQNSVFGTNTTEFGSLAYLIKEWGTKIRGSAGSGFRAPTFIDLFFPGSANPDLRPESSFSYDFGVDQKLWQNRIRLGLTYFRNTFTDLITCCPGPPTPLAPFGSPINLGRAKSHGIEFTSEADLLDTLLATVNYTFTDSEDLGTRHPLPRIPFHRWNIGLTWQPIPRLAVYTQIHTSSRQFETFGNVYNSGHTRVDIGGHYRLFQRHAYLQALDVTARIQNLLNEGYAEVRGFPALGTNFLFGLKAAF